MRYRNLGSTGVLVSELCLGTMTFGDGWGIGGIDDNQADTIVGSVLDAGINFIDTADIYSNGVSEEILGRSLLIGNRRDRVVLATKAYAAMGTGRNDSGLSKYHLIRACEASLKRLGTDRIDLYQVHGYDPMTPIEEVVGALDHLVQSGKVLYVGLCNQAAWQIALAVKHAKFSGLAPFVSAQMYYSLLGRDLEHDIVPLCRHEGLAILPWSPLAGGFLTGKYRREQTDHPQGSRFSTSAFGQFPPVDLPAGYDVVESLVAQATRLGTTATTLALKWLIDKPGVTSVIMGVRKLEQLVANLAATELALSPEDHKSIDDLTAPKVMYPNWMIQFQGTRYGRI